jgi:hypothetical protein
MENYIFLHYNTESDMSNVIILLVSRMHKIIKKININNSSYKLNY